MKNAYLEQRFAGLWIDHRRAVIVFISDSQVEFTYVLSNVERQLRRTDSFAANGRIAAPSIRPEDIQDRAFDGHLQRYYDQVIHYFRDGDKTLVLGPGEAKHEFIKRLEQKGAGFRVDGCVAADRISTRQIEARTREYFFPVSIDPGAKETAFRRRSRRAV